MNLLTDDISKLSFKVIKDEISKIDFNEFYNSSDYEKIVSILTADKRKNVSSLGAKIIKDKEKLDNEEARAILAQYIESVIRKALNYVRDKAKEDNEKS